MFCSILTMLHKVDLVHAAVHQVHRDSSIYIKREREREQTCTARALPALDQLTWVNITRRPNARVF